MLATSTQSQPTTAIANSTTTPLPSSHSTSRDDVLHSPSSSTSASASASSSSLVSSSPKSSVSSLSRQSSKKSKSKKNQPPSSSNSNITGSNLSIASQVTRLIRSIVPTMFLVCKFSELGKRSQPDQTTSDQSKRKVTERELSNLNHKIDKLLVKLEAHEPELASSSEEECVICISAKATMQTFPCGHRVVCRKCFVKTIQVAVSQRLLPLRCVICRAKILRLKQTTHGGIVTGHVLRSKHHGSHHWPGSSSTPTNPFYISPATSPVSPVTEVFREQRVVWVKNYDAFGYSSSGASPTSSTPSVSSFEASTTSTSSEASSLCLSTTTETFKPEPPRPVTKKSLREAPNVHAWNFQLERKKQHRLHVHRRRRHRHHTRRSSSTLLPIDEREEFEGLFSEKVPVNATKSLPTLAPLANLDDDEDLSDDEGELTSSSSSDQQQEEQLSISTSTISRDSSNEKSPKSANLLSNILRKVKLFFMV